MNRFLRTLAATTLAACPIVTFAEDKPHLQDGDTVAVIGDSITEQKLYSVFVEDYLLMCRPAAVGRVMQFGWGGETAEGFKNRMANDCFRYKPTVATTCYGMNDGKYGPQTPQNAKWYEDNQRAVVTAMKKAGVRFIVVGSPGCVDVNTFGKGNHQAAEIYNKTLASERDIAKKVAEEEGVAFADVYDPMVDVMTKAEAKYGPKYHVAGGDGVHPDQNGHLVMAYAFLKGLGCDGNVGTIRVDLAGDKAEASDGHKVISAKGGTVEVESSRYPFCFYGDPTSHSTRGVLEFLPFNEDLNRFTLVVTGATGKAKVTWGKETKTFDAEQLAKGINLAAEFLDNPFSEPFNKGHEAIRKQQSFETPMVKAWLHNLPVFRGTNMPEAVSKYEAILGENDAKDEQLFAGSKGAVTPVTHTIKIEKGE